MAFVGLYRVYSLSVPMLDNLVFPVTGTSFDVSRSLVLLT